jgi:hypothetical protein
MAVRPRSSRAGAARIALIAGGLALFASIPALGQVADDDLEGRAEKARLEQRERLMQSLLGWVPAFAAPPIHEQVCEVQERLYRYDEATRCHLDLYRLYPASKAGHRALWLFAMNSYRMHAWDDALWAFDLIASAPEFSGHEHRKDAGELAKALRAAAHR